MEHLKTFNESKTGVDYFMPKILELISFTRIQEMVSELSFDLEDDLNIMRYNIPIYYYLYEIKDIKQKYKYFRDVLSVVNTSMELLDLTPTKASGNIPFTDVDENSYTPEKLGDIYDRLRYSENKYVIEVDVTFIPDEKLFKNRPKEIDINSSDNDYGDIGDISPLVSKLRKIQNSLDIDWSLFYTDHNFFVTFYFDISKI